MMLLFCKEKIRLTIMVLNNIGELCSTCKCSVQVFGFGGQLVVSEMKYTVLIKTL